MADPKTRHHGAGRPSERPCVCPVGCACAALVLVGEGACEGCAPADDGSPGTDHVPCTPACTAPAPHVGRDGALTAS